MDEFRETLIEEGEAVFSVSWDSGAPGAGADSEFVYRLNHQYFGLLTWEDEPQGPFATLDEAIEATELYTITEATTSVSSTELGAEAIMSKLHPTVDAKSAHTFNLLINDEPWRSDEHGRLVKA